MLAYFAERDVVISTSLDGPATLHNANRPRPGGDSYERTIEGVRRVRQRLGTDRVAALMTTTRRSLSQPEAIVDEYAAQGFRSIFLRALSPYGFAARSGAATGYTMDEFLAFYVRALDRILALNRAGTSLVETYAQLLLTRMLAPFATGYVDLQSPAGAGIGAAVYNYDGKVYASGEGRMLAEMGDERFLLGDVDGSRRPASPSRFRGAATAHSCLGAVPIRYFIMQRKGTCAATVPQATFIGSRTSSSGTFSTSTRAMPPPARFLAPGSEGARRRIRTESTHEAAFDSIRLRSRASAHRANHDRKRGGPR